MSALVKPAQRARTLKGIVEEALEFLPEAVNSQIQLADNLDDIGKFKAVTIHTFSYIEKVISLVIRTLSAPSKGDPAQIIQLVKVVKQL